VSDPERRCPNCNALAAPDAEWCGQCFASLREAPSPPMPDPPAPAATATGEGAAETDEAARRPAGWPCAVCGGRNPIESDVCATCGTPFATVMRTDPARRPVDPQEAVRWSLIFPGLGHRLVGRSMDGLARGALFAISMAMAVLLAFAGSASAATTGVLLLFVFAGLAVYAGSAVEAGRLARGGELIVGSRFLMWILVGMTFLSVGALALAVVGATRG
jgi:ribosomal protein L40E